MTKRWARWWKLFPTTYQEWTNYNLCEIGVHNSFFFAGGSPYDIMGKYGISHLEVMESVWYVVEAINTVAEFAIECPESADEQEKIAKEIQGVSAANIDICAGAIEGILICIAKHEGITQASRESRG